MMGTMIDYWYYTGDTSYNKVIVQSIESQESPAADFEPVNQDSDLGNDDQAFWAFTVLEAAEYKFPNPPPDKPQWLALAQAVFNRQAGRWEKGVCGGGLRWQVLEFNNGYDYKNSGSNGAFLQIAARLAKYTRNSTYAEWAEKTWDWMEYIGLINSTTYFVQDGTYVQTNCTTYEPYVWSYNAAILVYGSAVMWNYTGGNTTWESRTRNLLEAMQIFFQSNIMAEYECETNDNCNNDQQSFKAYTARFLAVTTRVAPWTFDLIHTWLSASAYAAAKSCTGGTTGTLCGLKWTVGHYDGTTGAGEEMAALEVIGAQIMYSKPGPLSAKTGAISKGNASAGSAPPLTLPGSYTKPITTGDRAGAGILTTLLGLASIGCTAFIII